MAPGLEYEHRRMEGPLSVHILWVDPRKLAIFPVHALSDGVGRERVSSMARRQGALAAVNGGFFNKGELYDGDPAGLLKTGQGWLSGSRLPRGAIGWSRSGDRYLVGRVTSRWELVIAGKGFPVAGLNRARRSHEAVLYTWAFHRSTLTDPGGVEVVVRRGRVDRVTSRGNARIPEDGFVYSLGPKAAQALPDELSPGREAQLRLVLESDQGASQAWEQMDFVVGGTPVLIRRGAPVESYEIEQVSPSFVQKKHPRTALCIDRAGIWIFVVVDGRQPQLSVGMTLKELESLLLALGCVEALNLDGGGSSVLVVKQQVLNSPADLSGERSVSDAILVAPRLPPR